MPKLRDSSVKVHEATIRASIADVAAFLQDVLGQRLVAYITQTADPKTVGRWAAGEQAPRQETDRRLRDAQFIFQLLMQKESTHTVRAWFVGLNPQLDDESPADALREGRSRDVMVAAKSFLAGG